MGGKPSCNSCRKNQNFSFEVYDIFAVRTHSCTFFSIYSQKRRCNEAKIHFDRFWHVFCSSKVSIAIRLRCRSMVQRKIVWADGQIWGIGGGDLCIWSPGRFSSVVRYANAPAHYSDEPSFCSLCLGKVLVRTKN